MHTWKYDNCPFNNLASTHISVMVALPVPWQAGAGCTILIPPALSPPNTSLHSTEDLLFHWSFPHHSICSSINTKASRKAVPLVFWNPQGLVKWEVIEKSTKNMGKSRNQNSGFLSLELSKVWGPHHKRSFKPKLSDILLHIPLHDPVQRRKGQETARQPWKRGKLRKEAGAKTSRNVIFMTIFLGKWNANKRT